MAQIMVQYGRPSRSSWTESVRSSFGRTIMGKAIWENPIEIRLGGRCPIGNVYSLTLEKGLFLSVYVDDIKLAGKKQNISPTWKYYWKTLIWENQHHSSTMFVWVALKEDVRLARILWIITEICSNQGFPPGLRKNYQEQKPWWNLMPKRYLHGPMTWKVTQRNACERYCEFANQTTEQLYKVTTPCMDDHQSKEEENMDQWQNYLLFARTLFWNVFFSHVLVDWYLWSVNKLARAVTKWTKACDKRVALLISYIHHTCEYRQYCHVGNTAKQCRLGLFKDFDFAGDFEESKSTSGGILCFSEA